MRSVCASQKPISVDMYPRISGYVSRNGDNGMVKWSFVQILCFFSVVTDILTGLYYREKVFEHKQKKSVAAFEFRERYGQPV